MKYIELESKRNGKTLFKIDSIKEISGYDINKVLINGSEYDITYERLKQIILSDERRMLIDYKNWSAILIWFARYSIFQRIEEIGPELTEKFIREMCQECFSELDIISLYNKYLKIAGNRSDCILDSQNQENK